MKLKVLSAIAEVTAFQPTFLVFVTQELFRSVSMNGWMSEFQILLM